MTRDIHCVTKWSKFDTSWEGVSVDTLARRCRDVGGLRDGVSATAATPPTCRSTTSPAARPGSRSAFDGQPLESEHGGPARLLVPHLYFWKSAKWIRGLRLDERGFAGLLGDIRLPHVWRSLAGTALQRRLIWRTAEVVELVDETPRVRSAAADGPGWPGQQAGQHVDVRLTADDGYQAQRSYSISSAPSA